MNAFRYQVYHFIARIPAGRVTTYGQVAKATETPRAARQVGYVLKHLPENSTLPWYRVVNHQGKISLQGEDYQRQKKALLAEGIEFNEQDRIDFKRFYWSAAEEDYTVSLTDDIQ